MRGSAEVNFLFPLLLVGTTMKTNYRFNQNNQQPYRVTPWAQQNAPSGPWVDYANNSYWPPYQGGGETHNNANWRRVRKPVFGKDGRLLNGSQKRKKNWRAKIAREKKLAAAAAPKGILMAVVPFDFPPRTMHNDELEKFQEAVLKEIDKVGPDGFRPQFLTGYKRRGMFMISCHNPESVEWLKTTVETLNPWEGVELKVVDAEELPVYKNIFIAVPDSNEEPQKILKRLQHQNVGLKTNSWHMIHNKIEDTNLQTLKISVEESVIKTFEQVGFKLFLNFSQVDVKVLGITGDGVKIDIGKVEDKKVDSKDTEAMETNSVKEESEELEADQSKMSENDDSAEDHESS